MKLKKNTFFDRLDFFLFGWAVNILYPKYFRPKYGYQRYYLILLHYFIPQKVFRLNPKVQWPVHFTSRVIAPENIKKGILCDPGDNLNNYIQATNGIDFGDNVELGPGVHIISANHDIDDFSTHVQEKRITIGSNVWIGANSIILPGVKIGDNVVIGAGSVVCHDIPNNSVALGNPCKVIKFKKPYSADVYSISLNRKVN